MTALIARFMPHLVVAPILLPMAVAAVMLLLGEGRKAPKVVLGVGATLGGLAVSVALLAWVDAFGPVTYVPGGWPARFGIAVVADRLSAMMLVLGWVLGTCVLVFAAARWHRAGIHFHPLVQLELMGVSGAFVAGDLFNLFVFFEILLAASYGLLLHGSGRARIVAGLHYLAVNLVASSLFLIGATMLYGMTGTLNLAVLSQHMPGVAAADRGLLHAGAAILGVAFLTKAAVWPLGLWLAPAYSAATAPSAALFAILTEVGVYALLRTSTLLLSGGASAALDHGLLVFGLITAALASLGAMGTARADRQAAWTVVVSAGTLVAALGLGRVEVTAGALFYLPAATLAASALFLVIDLVERWRNAGATRGDDAPYLTPALEEHDVNLDDDEQPLVGVPFPASTAFLAIAFLACTVLVAGLPPLATFVGKVAMLAGAVDGAAVSPSNWVFVAVLLGSGLVTLVAMLRTGIRCFWSARRPPATIRLPEALPILALLAASVALTIGAGAASRYSLDAARALHAPAEYVRAVVGTEGSRGEAR